MTTNKTDHAEATGRAAGLLLLRAESRLEGKSVWRKSGASCPDLDAPETVD